MSLYRYNENLYIMSLYRINFIIYDFCSRISVGITRCRYIAMSLYRDALVPLFYYTCSLRRNVTIQRIFEKLLSMIRYKHSMRNERNLPPHYTMDEQNLVSYRVDFITESKVNVQNIA